MGTDPWVVAQTLASLAALMIALIAIWLAVRQGTKARRDLLEERRDAHRLDVLRSLAELWGLHGGVIAGDQRLHGMLLALPSGWFRLLRAWTGVEPSEAGLGELQRLVDRQAVRRAESSKADAENFRSDRSRWPEAITSDVVEELRRRIAETAHELDRLDSTQRRRRTTRE